MGEVVSFTGITTVPEDPAATLEKAKSWGLARVIIIGANDEGELLFGGSLSDVPEMAWLLDKAKQCLMDLP